VKQGYDPESCNIQTFFLRFSGERQRGHMVFVEESDDKVFGCISLESVICKSIELLPGDNAGQGFSFLLPPEEEARIADAIRVWEEQGEELRHVKEEPVDLDTLPDTQGGAQDSPPVRVCLSLLSFNTSCPGLLTATVSTSNGSHRRSERDCTRSTRSSASGRARKEGANTYSTGLRVGNARVVSSKGRKGV
jgi:hypothetical protein